MAEVASIFVIRFIMKPHFSLQRRPAAAALAGWLTLVGGLGAAAAGEAVPPARTNAPPPAVVKPAAKPRHQLTGAELYSMHCNRCHPERYPTERTAAQWKTIVLHMQVRANLPPPQARMILKYLQENSGR